MNFPSMLKHPRLLAYVLRHPRIFILGWHEGHDDLGLTYDDDPYSSRSQAYDTGRDLRRWGKS